MVDFASFWVTVLPDFGNNCGALRISGHGGQRFSLKADTISN
jgi:hypothetical protein